MLTFWISALVIIIIGLGILGFYYKKQKDYRIINTISIAFSSVLAVFLFPVFYKTYSKLNISENRVVILLAAIITVYVIYLFIIYTIKAVFKDKESALPVKKETGENKESILEEKPEVSKEIKDEDSNTFEGVINKTDKEEESSENKTADDETDKTYNEPVEEIPENDEFSIDETQEEPVEKPGFDDIFGEDAVIKEVEHENLKDKIKNKIIEIGKIDTDSKKIVNEIEADIDKELEEMKSLLQFDINNINECIRLALDEKEKGNLKKTSIIYLEVLNMPIDKDTATMIIVDLCTIYKNLGWINKAKDVLNELGNNKDLIDEDIKLEIERNLLYI